MFRVRQILPSRHTNFSHLPHQFSAAALATGCTHQVKLDHAYNDLVQNSVLGAFTLERRTFKSEC